MVMERLLAGAATATVGSETGEAVGVAAEGAAGGTAGAQAGAGAGSVDRAGRAAAELEAALGLRIVSISSAVAPALVSRIISVVERSNWLFFDDLTWLT